MSHNLYFVAVVPPDDVAAEVLVFKERMAEKYHSLSALRHPAHITLFPPIQLQEDMENDFIAILNDVASRHHTFDLTLNGFGAFPPKVIFVKPEKELRMNILSRELVDSFIHHIAPLMELRGFKFKAHLTIGYRDLDPTVFPAAWSEFKNKHYQRTFTVTDVCLLRHDSKKWNVIHRAKLARVKQEEAEQSLDLFG